MPSGKTALGIVLTPIAPHMGSRASGLAPGMRARAAVARRLPVDEDVDTCARRRPSWLKNSVSRSPPAHSTARPGFLTYQTRSGTSSTSSSEKRSGQSYSRLFPRMHKCLKKNAFTVFVSLQIAKSAQGFTYLFKKLRRTLLQA